MVLMKLFVGGGNRDTGIKNSFMDMMGKER